MGLIHASVFAKQISYGLDLNRRCRYNNSETSARHACDAAIGEQRPADIGPFAKQLRRKKSKTTLPLWLADIA